MAIPPTRRPPSRLVNSDPGFPPPVRASGAAPVIVTATMGAADQRFFNALRAAHYPSARNHVPAHITLFHQLPPSSLGELKELVRRIAADTPPPAATLVKPYSLETGVAFRIDSRDLLAIRERIASHFEGLLTVQDRGTPRLHITVQNKVAPHTARALLSDLAHSTRPRAITIAGLAAYLYRGGAWETAFSRNFRGRRGAY